ncbi:MAG: PulJ/GspJ family protein [Planctomycetota bacterium]|jgi:type II secretory pathway pseudopilin PulG
MNPTEQRPCTLGRRSPQGEGGRHPAPGTASSGFTLVELMVAMFVTVLLGTIIVMAYNTSMQSYYRTEKQLQALAAFRNVTDRMEREVNSMVFKASVYGHPVPVECTGGYGYAVVFWDTRMKYLHGDAWINSDPYAWTVNAPSHSNYLKGSTAPTLAPGDWWKVNPDPDAGSMYRINFRPRYMGYYSSLDGFTIDRTEWYYNPAEEKQKWANGLDDDFDDPDGAVGLRILYDDRGCLMFRKRFDADMLWAEWDLTAGSPNEYRDLYHGPYSRGDFPPQADELVGPLVNWDANGDGFVNDSDKTDYGTVIGEGFSDMRFYYVYKLKHSERFIYADWWPWDDDGDPTNANGKDSNMPKKTITCRVGGSWDGKKTGDSWVQIPDDITPDPATTSDFDICYFSLPMAVSVKFTFKVGRHSHVYEKLIFLHASRWLKYLNP